jgi:Uncharacterized protein conserved in bacteria
MNFYSVAPFIEKYYPQYYSIETYPVTECVPIRKVSDEWGILCNFARTPIKYDGVSYKSAEQLFQMMKFTDEEVRKKVYAANNPKMTAKHYEKTHRRSDWGMVIVDAMKQCLQLKYEQSEEFRAALERSKGKYIVEDQSTFPKKTADTWGVKQQGDSYVGPNLLGRLLMELRDNGRLEFVVQGRNLRP